MADDTDKLLWCHPKESLTRKMEANHSLSHLKGQSVNDGIETERYLLRCASVDEAVMDFPNLISRGPIGSFPSIQSMGSYWGWLARQNCLWTHVSHLYEVSAKSVQCNNSGSECICMHIYIKKNVCVDTFLLP